MQIPISDIYLDKQKEAQIFLLKITKREKKAKLSGTFVWSFEFKVYRILTRSGTWI